MHQLNIYLPDNLAKAVHLKAVSAGKTDAEYITDIVAAHIHPTWTDTYKTQVLGGWHGDPPERPEPTLPEEREAW
jgi:hypothetical protein